MKISKNTVVTLQYRVSDAQGQLLEDMDQPLQYLHGGYDEIFPKVEEALSGKETGYETTLHLEPEDAFGEYDAELLRVEAREKFPEPLEVGMQFEGVPDEATEDAAIYTVTDLAQDKVVLDGNHPYAGIALRFEVKVLDVRPATDDEIAMERALSDDDEAEEGEEEEDAQLDEQIEVRRGKRTLH